MPHSSPRVDFAVIGGGIIGACVADELAHAGASVVVVDAGQRPGHATPRAAGVAVPSLRYLSDSDFFDWLAAGRARLLDDIGTVAESAEAFSVAGPILRALRPADTAFVESHLNGRKLGSWVTPDEAAALVPGLGLPADREYLRSDDGLVVDGGRYLAHVCAGALARGVDWRQGAEVRQLLERPGGVDLETDAGPVTADQVVLAAGAWSGDARFGKDVPVFPVRGQLVRLASTVMPAGILSSTHYLAPDVDGRLIVGATEENAGFDDRCTAAGIARLLRFAVTAMPPLADATPVAWTAGLRPATVTGHPLVGRVPNRQRVYIAAGHAGFGLLTARLTAQGLVRGLVADDWDLLPESMCPSLVAAR
jgi:glycine oxidase